MQIDSAFRPMVELEQELADLYTSWADLFESDREAAFVFFKMSREEKGHASLIEYQRRVFQKNRLLSTDVEIDPTMIQATIEQVRQVRRAVAPPSLTEAIVIALNLEASAAESHYKNALKQANPELERLLTSLGGDDRAHHVRLREFAVHRGIAPIP